MQATVQLVTRQSGWLVFFALFALMNGAYVCEGLWQGGGLHGYVIQHSAKGGPPRVVPVWTAFVQMLVFVGLAGMLLGISLWQKARHGFQPVARHRSPAPQT